MMRALLVLAIATAALVACTSAEQSNFGASQWATTGNDDDDGKTPAKAATGTVPSNLPTKANTTAVPAFDPFEGAGAFTEPELDTTTSDHHLGDSNAGKNCLSCHDGSLAPKFMFAGTIQASASDDSPAAGVEVRVVDGSGKEIGTTGTDEHGNFWLKSTGDLPAGARVGIRDASGTQKMSAAIAVGACNQGGCHSSNRPIFLAK